jgi:hypothetical protein
MSKTGGPSGATSSLEVERVLIGREIQISMKTRSN